MGANGGAEVLAHPFFANIDTTKLLAKEIRAPFVPKASDPEAMRSSSDKVVRLRELLESVPDEDHTNQIDEVNQSLFGNFGTNIDQTELERLAEAKRQSEEMRQRQLQRAGSEEETKPLPQRRPSKLQSKSKQ